MSLYEQVMGEAFARLDPPVQAFHRLAGVHELHGEVRVEASWSPLGRLVAKWIGAPSRSGHGPMRLGLEAAPHEERWHYHFPTGAMVSHLQGRAQGVVERLGPLRMCFALEEVAGRLHMRMLGVRAFGIPVPAWLWPRIIAEESGRGTRLYFMVRAALPVVGPLIAYTGYVVLPPEAGAA